MKQLKDLSLAEIDTIFRAATTTAQEEAAARDLPKVGLDEHGKLVEHPAYKVNYTGRSVA